MILADLVLCLKTFPQRIKGPLVWQQEELLITSFMIMASAVSDNVKKSN